MQVLTHVMAFMIGGIVGITALALLMAEMDEEWGKLSVFPTQQELDEMSKSELLTLWKKLLDECSLREGAIAGMAFDIGCRMSAGVVDE